MSENRKHMRVMSRLRCWCEGDNVTVYASIGNLSEGGIFLRTSTPLEAGSRATLRFGSEHLVEMVARVVWVFAGDQGAPGGMGLAFEALDEGTRSAIRQMIDSELFHTTSS